MYCRWSAGNVNFLKSVTTLTDIPADRQTAFSMTTHALVDWTRLLLPLRSSFPDWTRQMSFRVLSTIEHIQSRTPSNGFAMFVFMFCVLLMCFVHWIILELCCACYCYLGSVLFVFVFDCGLNSGWLCLTNVWGENWFPALLGLSPVFTTSIDRSCLLSVKNSHIVCQGLFSGSTDNLVLTSIEVQQLKPYGNQII